MRFVKTTILFLGLFILIGAIQVGCETSYRLIFGKASYSTKAIFQIPQTNVEIILERRAIHLFLAEYERTLILRVDGKEVLRQEGATDSGGYSRMNVYEISPTEYFLSGDISYDKHELDIMRLKINSVVLIEKPTSAKFIGAFDIDEKRIWRFITTDERVEQKSKFKK
ncbi:MAG: hypothetical protein H0X15_04880 [Acidobacteria bacterium]|jgi:hypothetical protein|nr:hypothetical protein [Acidobacteriota bacterium]MBA3784863.1 hypothetical protein [Acidobacteriota bacterium]MBA4183003.1 hypothetical protein [Acidobacteriota bacterium]